MGTQYTRYLADEARRQRELRQTYQNNYEEAQADYKQAIDAYKTGNNINSLNMNALAYYNTVDSKIKKQQRDAEAAAKKERDSMDWLTRTFHTIGDGLGRFTQGVMKFGENIVDAGATLFGADEEWIAKDHVDDWFGNALRNGTKGSYLNDGKVGETIGDVLNGVGNMLPSIALNIIPGIGQAASMGSFMANAAGQGMENSLANGATRGEALGYGTLSGISEGLIEKMSGGIGGVGKGVLDSVGKGAVKTGIRGGIGRAAKTFVGEGLEEVASDLLDPILAGIYKHKIDYSGVTPDSLLNTFTVGGLSGSLMQGGQAVARKALPTLDMRTRLGEIQEQNSQLDRRYNRGKLSEKQFNHGISNADILRNETISKFNRMNERKQNKVLNKIAEQGFNDVGLNFADGVMQNNINNALNNSKIEGNSLNTDNNYINATQNTSYAANIDANNLDSELDNSKIGANSFNKNNINDTMQNPVNGVNNHVSELNNSKIASKSLNNGNEASIGMQQSYDANADTRYNYKAMTPSLRGRESELAYRPTAQKLTAEQESVIKEHGKLTNGNTKIVFTDNIDAGGVSANGAYSNGVIYISRNAADPMTEVLKHEFTHSLENSKGYGGFARYVIRTIQQDSELSKQFGDVLQSTAKVTDDYSGVLDMTHPNAQTDIMKEVVARYAEKLLSDPKAISRIARANKGMAGKILSYIQRKLAIAKSQKSNKNTVKFLTTAEALYSKAIQGVNKGKLQGITDNKIIKDADKIITNDKNGNKVMYDIGKPFAEQVDDVIAKNHDPNIDLFVSKTPKVLVDIGFKNTALLMKNSKINEILTKHSEMTTEIIKEIPNAIDKPLLVLKSKTNPNESVVVISEINTEKGSLILPIWMNVDGQYYDIELNKIVSNKYNFVASAYGRNIKSLLEYAIKNNEILYHDKNNIKKVRQIFNTHGLQLPAPLNMSNSNNSISKTDMKVNEIAKESPKSDTQFSISSNKNDKNKQKKTYTHDDAKQITRELISGISPGVKLMNESKIADMIYKDMNNPNILEGGTAVELAEKIVNNAYFEVYDAESVERASDLIELFDKHIKKKYNLESIRAELSEQFGASIAGNIIKNYGNPNGLDINGIAEFKNALGENGVNIEKSMNAAEVFADTYKAVKNARETVSGDKVMLKDSANRKELNAFVQKLIKLFQMSYDTHGSETKLYKDMKALQDKYSNLKHEFEEHKNINELRANVFNHVRLFNEWHKKGIGVDYLKGDLIFDNLAKSLGKVISRGEIRSSNVSLIIKNLKQFYTVERLDIDADMQVIADIQELDKEMEGMDNRLKNNLTMHQLTLLNRVLGGMRTYLLHADSISRNGERARISELSQRGVETLQNTKRLGKRGKIGFFLRKLRGIVDPTCYFALLENCDNNGVLQMLYDDLKIAESNQRATVIDFMNPFDKFFQDNKEYRKSLANEIDFAGKKVSRDSALYAYMLSKRDQAKPALYGYTNAQGKYYEGGGFNYRNRRGEVVEIKVTKEDMERLERSLSKEDWQFIKLAEEFFQEKASEVKKETDIRLLGYTNVIEDSYYVPIMRDRASIAKKVSDTRDFIADVQNISNMSFNKALAPNARNTINLSGLFNIIVSHAELVSVYANMSEAMRNFDRVLMRNTNQGTPNGSTLSMQSELEKLDSHAIKYITELMQDLQAAGRQKHNAVIDFFRNGYIKSVLGFNPKTILSQFAGFGFAAAELSPKSIAKGIAMKFDKEAYNKYSAYGRSREYNKTSVRAEGVTDKIGKVGNFATKGIQFADELMMHRLWNACLAGVESKQGLKLGTEANYIAGAKLYEKMARETQSNDGMSEKSAWQRSENVIIRTFTMFKSDAVKQLSRLVQSFAGWQYAAAKYKINKTAETAQALKQARRKFIRTVSAATLSNAMYVAVALLFTCMLGGKDDKGKKMDGADYLKQFGAGMAESFFGLFPIVSDIYNKITSGYEIENFTYSMLNDLTDGVYNVGKLVAKAVTGEVVTEQEAVLSIKKFMYSIGSIFGIPLRNMEKYPKMIVGWISPSAVIKYDSLFYPIKTSALNSAIADKDDISGKAIFQTLFTVDKSGGELSDAAIDEMYKLYADKYLELPRSVPKRITYTDGDGNEQTKVLTAKEYDEFKNEYAKASDEVNKLVKTTRFMTIGKKQQGEVIRRIYDYYYSELRSKYIGNIKPNTAAIVAKLFDVSTMSVLMTKANAIESDKNPNGKAIPNTRKRKILSMIQQFSLTFDQNQLILLLLGYAPSNPRAIQRLITNKNLSKEEKSYLLDKLS